MPPGLRGRNADEPRNHLCLGEGRREGKEEKERQRGQEEEGEEEKEQRSWIEVGEEKSREYVRKEKNWEKEESILYDMQKRRR